MIYVVVSLVQWEIILSINNRLLFHSYAIRNAYDHHWRLASTNHDSWWRLIIIARNPSRVYSNSYWSITMHLKHGYSMEAVYFIILLLLYSSSIDFHKSQVCKLIDFLKVYIQNEGIYDPIMPMVSQWSVTAREKTDRHFSMINRTPWSSKFLLRIAFPVVFVFFFLLSVGIYTFWNGSKRALFVRR